MVKKIKIINYQHQIIIIISLIKITFQKNYKWNIIMIKKNVKIWLIKIIIYSTTINYPFSIKLLKQFTIIMKMIMIMIMIIIINLLMIIIMMIITITIIMIKKLQCFK